MVGECVCVGRGRGGGGWGEECGLGGGFAISSDGYFFFCHSLMLYFFFVLLYIEDSSECEHAHNRHIMIRGSSRNKIHLF